MRKDGKLFLSNSTTTTTTKKKQQQQKNKKKQLAHVRLRRQRGHATAGIRFNDLTLNSFLK